MREFLTSGVVGNIEYNTQKNIREEIQNRWDSLGFTEGLPQGVIKENIATLYENEAKHLLHEATDATNSGSFETVVFPIIRRVFSKLLANDIVSVQAMNLPVGKLFFILPVTSEREWSVDGMTDEQLIADIEQGKIVDGTVGRHKGLMGYDRVNKNKKGAVEPRYYLPDEVVEGIANTYYSVLDPSVSGVTEAELLALSGSASGHSATEFRKVGPEVTQYFQKSLYDLFYDDFLFDNSKGKVTLKVAKAEKAELKMNGSWVTGTGAKVPLAFDGTARNLVLKVSGFNAFNAGKLTGPDGNEMDTEEFLASMKVITKKGITGTSGTVAYNAYEAVPTWRVVTQRYGKGIVEYTNPCDAEGNMYIEIDLAKPLDGTVDGYAGISADDATPDNFIVAWAQYDSLELETEIGEVSFKLDSVTVSVTERKLRATWSPELSTDVNAFHNIDAEAELTSILSEQIAAEVDREILRDLRKVAPWQKRFDVEGWRKLKGFSTNYTRKDWIQELFTAINQISAQINKSTLRGGANWIVVSAEISALLDTMEYFHVTDASAESAQYNMGIEKIGALNGRYQVIVDPYAPHWSLIMGHKGKSLLDTGYIYAPYVPMQLTPTMYNPFNFAPIKGIATRYAKKVVCNKYFGAIRVDNLVHWSTAELR
jgi:hypothetical protein